MLVDSHCHLNAIDLGSFNNSLENVIHTAQKEGVTHMLTVCTELSEVPVLTRIAEHFTSVSMSVGLHPTTEIPLDKEPSTTELTQLAAHPRCIAIGETGLDYYRVATEQARDQQRRRFAAHIQAALSANKPLIIHTRQAAEDTLDMMRAENAQTFGGVMHCFSESWDIARQALDLNFYISISGIVTFKNATVLQEVAKKVPLDRLLIETDSPWLAPVPYRGKQNHPALVKYVAQTLSDLRQIPFEEVAQQTTANFYRCFGLSIP